MRGASALAAITVCAAGLALPGCRARHGAGGLEDVVAAAGGRRQVEPRLSGGFAYAPCHAGEDPRALIPESLCAPPPDPESWAGVAASVDRAAGRRPSPENLRAQAFVQLVLPAGEPAPQSSGAGPLRGAAGPEPAVAALEQALAQTPGDASLWSDLTAAHFVQAQRAGDPYELIAALEAADRAVALDATRPEALFNRALVLEHLFLDGAAREAWRNFLSVDARSGWAEEARAHLAALEQPLAVAPLDRQEKRLAQLAVRGEDLAATVRQAPLVARETAERHLLRAWAELTQGGDELAAARVLAATRTVGEILAQTTGERFVLDVVTAIEAAEGDRERLALLARGHAVLCRGVDDYHARHLTEARAELEAARAALARAGSPARATAEFFLASSDYMQGRRQQAAQAFARLEPQLSERGHLSLAAHAEWMRGLSSAVLGHAMDSIGAYERSIARFDQIGETANAGQVCSLLGSSLERLGRHHRAWEPIYRGLRAARPPVGDFGARFLAYVEVVDSMLRQGRTEFALAFQNEAVAAAERATEESLLPDSLYWRSLIESRLGRSELAAEDARRAEKGIATVTDPPLRRALGAGLAAIRAEMSLATDPEAAIGSLSEAVEFFRQTEHRLLALRAYQNRARAYLERGDREHAGSDLVSALGVYEELGRSANPDDVAPEELRLSFLEETAGFFDELIAFELESGRPDLAWAYADRARTRVLPASAVRDPDTEQHPALLAAEPEPLALGDIQRELPPGTTILDYAVLGDRLLVWRLRRGANDLFTAPVAPAALAPLVTALRSGGQKAEEASARLFDGLLRRPLAGVGPGESLVIVPDKLLHAVPFAALRGPDGHYLVEDHRIAVAPSATLYVRAVERERAMAAAAQGPARTLVLGDPAIDVNLYAELKPLPGARAEAEEVAAGDPQHSLLRLGKLADRASFLALAPGFERIHIAGHALVDGRNPLLSALVLAPSGAGDTGALYAKEIYSLRLPRTRLVVLAACDTGDAAIPGSEGATSLARAFLAAGVPTVVASLWEVDDAVTERLLSLFHSELRAGRDPASALRRAQIALLHAPETAALRSPDWGAFEVFGASLQETIFHPGRVQP